MATPVDTYPGETLDVAVELLARVRALGLLTDEADQVSDIASDVDGLLEGFPHLAHVPRCPVGAHVLEIESWDTPVEYCRNDCDSWRKDARMVLRTPRGGEAMDRMALVQAGLEGAIRRLEYADADAVAYIATGEALFWAIAADEVLLATSPQWEAHRGKLFQGLRYPRNVAAHDVSAWMQPGEDPFSDRWWGGWHDWVWREMPPPREGHERERRQYLAFKDRVSGRSVRDTLADARDLIESEQADYMEDPSGADLQG